MRSWFDNNRRRQLLIVALGSGAAMADGIFAGLFIFGALVVALWPNRRHPNSSSETSLSDKLASIEVATSAMDAHRMRWLATLSGGIAHEINNPLAIIRGRADLIRRHIRSGKHDVQTIERDLNSIESNVSRISRIVTSLIQFSGDNSPENFESISLNDLIQQSLVFCRERFYNHGIDLIEPEPANLPILECHIVDVMQVLFNLMTNSFEAIQQIRIKDMAEETRTAKSYWVKIEVTDANDHIVIAVCDNGAGIQPELRDKVLEPFFSTKGAGRETLQVQHGIGMGLTIACRVLDAHGGTLTLDTSSPYTRFELRLPKKPAVLQTYLKAA